MRRTDSAASRTRTVPASREEVWRLIADPFHMPRWWPGVERAEAVTDEGWTLVFRAARGRTVPVRYRLLSSEEPWHRAWEQEVAGTPFERVLQESVTEFHLQPAGQGATEVTLSQRQRIRGYSWTGRLVMSRGAAHKLDQILEGLGGICGQSG